MVDYKYDYSNMSNSEIGAMELALQSLAWCIVRLGGEVVIPQTVLKTVEYKLDSLTDAQGRVHLMAEEVAKVGDGGEQSGDDADIPF
jgi:hypothetical protein